MTYLAVFDWNGTVFDDVQASFEGANAALAALGHEPITLKRYQDTFDFPIIHFYTRNGIDTDKFLTEITEANKAFHPVYEDVAKSCAARKDAEKILKWLNDNDVTCMILSNHLLDSVTENLKRLGLDSYFQHISCNTDKTAIVTGLNKQDRLQSFMDKHGFDPAKAFIIGDSLEEPAIARHLGLMSVSIFGGYISESRLKDADPDHFIRDFADLPAILGREWGLSS